MMKLKLEIHHACVDVLKEKMDALQCALKDLQQGAESDAKSSAGDKHETARAMMQIEHEQISRQLAALMQQYNVLMQLQPEKETKLAVLGSLVQTDHGNFYLSIALGKVQKMQHSAIALSPQSPLGLMWLGAKASDVVVMNNVKYTIQAVC
jgi:hypothetical protein